MQDPYDTSHHQHEYELPVVPYIPHPRVKPQPSTEQPADAQLPSPSPSQLFSSPLPSTPLKQEEQREEFGNGIQKIRPGRRRRGTLIIVLGAVVVLLALGLLAAFVVVPYVNRSTPSKTLDAFCSALLRTDYQTAYDQLSPGLQSRFSESDFAGVLQQNKVVQCTHGQANESGKSVTTDLQLIHASKGVNRDKVTLTKDTKSIWKIDDLKAA